MGERLTKWRRQAIACEICDYAFEKRTAALAAAKPALFKAVVAEVYGADTIRKIARLPAHWFRSLDGISLNVDGWSYYLKVDAEHGIRAPYHQGSATEDGCRQPTVKDASLAAAIKAHAQDEEVVRKARVEMERAVRGLLMSCSTLEAFLDVMPDARSMLKKKQAIPAETGKLLVVSGREIMCLVAAARDEARPGCADGKLVEAA